MKNKLKKEIIIKTNFLSQIIMSIISSIFITGVIYYVFHNNGVEISTFVQFATENMSFKLALIMFPIVCLFDLILRLGIFVVNDGSIQDKKTKKK